MSTAPRFHVLTRMSRPGNFVHCRASVRAQTWPHVRHLVCIDDPAHAPVVADLETVLVERRTPAPGASFPWNLYFNTLYERIEDGWLIFLDDDDVLASPTVLAELAARIEEDGQDPDTVYLGQVWFPRRQRCLPWPPAGSAPVSSDMVGAGLCFHARHRSRALWDGEAGADRRLIERLHRALPRLVWWDRILVMVQDRLHQGSRETTPPERLPRLDRELVRLARTVEALRKGKGDGPKSPALARIQAEQEAARAHAGRLQAQLDAITNSTAWRLTAPLRRLAGWLRGPAPSPPDPTERSPAP